MECHIDLICGQENGNKLTNICVVGTWWQTQPDRFICASQNDPPIQNRQAIEQLCDLEFL
jgi:hypothetical protein